MGFKSSQIFLQVLLPGEKKNKEKKNKEMSLFSDVSSDPDNVGNPLQNTWGENACKQLRLSLLAYTCSGVDKKEIKGLTDSSRQQ